MTTALPTKFALAVLAAGQAERTAAQTRRKSQHEVKRGHIGLAHLEEEHRILAEKSQRQLELVNAGVSVAQKAMDTAGRFQNLETSQTVVETPGAEAQVGIEDGAADTGAADVAQTSKEGFLKKWGSVFQDVAMQAADNYGRNLDTDLEDAPQIEKVMRDLSDAVDEVIELEGDHVDRLTDLKRKIWALTGSDSESDSE